jgi:CRP-like cAMP-binding protein
MIGIDQIFENIDKNYIALSKECKEDYKKAASLVTYEKSKKIVVEGQMADKTYFILSGSARAYYVKDGKDITDWFSFENDFICSINSFFLNIPSPHFIEVLEQTTLLEITRDNMTILCDKYHEFDRLGRIVATKIMLQLQQRIVSIQFETAQQKYDNLLSIRPDITQRIPLTHIASYLGITLETLSRIRNPKNRI